MIEMKILQTMNMVDEEYLVEMNEVKGQSRRGKRKITTLVVIAALVAVMGVGVFAKEYRSVVEDWFYWFFAANKNNACFDNLTSYLIGNSRNTAFQNVRKLHNNTFDFKRADAVA